MKIALIQASSQKEKNMLLFGALSKAAPQGAELINFGIFDTEEESYSYVEVSLLVALLLNSKAVDFVVTGCSSGQGMMLACNNWPGVICGYTPTPADAFLFGRINGGNAISLPLGLGFGWSGEINLQCTLDKLFYGEFGCGYPAKDSARKQKDTLLLKEINKQAKKELSEILPALESAFLAKVMTRRLVIDYILQQGKNIELKALLLQLMENTEK